jgi:hypothetical protein
LIIEIMMITISKGKYQFYPITAHCPTHNCIFKLSEQLDIVLPREHGTDLHSPHDQACTEESRNRGKSMGCDSHQKHQIG